MPPATLAKRGGTYDETQFDMPRIAQAKPVLWFPDRHAKDCYTAFVLKVDDRSVDVAIMRPEHATLHLIYGVRHRNDPDGEIIDRSHSGVWDFPEDSDNDLTLVMKSVKGLGDRIERLEKALLEKK